MKQTIKPFPLTAVQLLKWINGDPYKEAKLISEVPLKASTLGRIKSGSYKPSVRMANAILAVMKRE